MKSRGLIPCILALEFFAIVCGVSVFASLRQNGGRFIYPLDDTYISMAISKNLAEHSVMGLTRHGFSFSSSCPLWIWLIAAGDWAVRSAWWVPLALGLLAGVSAIWIADRVLRQAGREGNAATLGLSSVIVLTPLPAMALSGMEHALHIGLCLAFVAGASRFLAEDGANTRFIALAALLPVMVLTRYESLFLAGIFALLLAARRKWLQAASSLLLAAAPVFLLGLISVSKGWPWLPNSLLLKGNIPDLHSLGGVLQMLGLRSVGLLFGTPHLLALTAALLAVAIWRAARGEGFWTSGQLMLVFAIGGIFLHLQFAGVGWFYRYEAYLVALGVIALFVNRFDELVRETLRLRVPVVRAAAALAILLAVLPPLARAAEAIWAFPAAAHNVFEQQYQMALFFQTYYPDGSIALNDIGAVNYFADVRCLDLYGLADREILSLKRRGAYTTQAMEARAAAAGVRVAVVYERRFGADYGPPIPSSWTRVGSWRIFDNAFLGGDTVTFYAVEPGEAGRLAQCLRSFAPRLPDRVAQQVLL